MRQQRRAGLGELHAAPDTIEQPCAQLRLEAADAFAHGGLSYEQRFGRAGEGAGVDHAHECLQCADVHHSFRKRINTINIMN